MVKYLLDTNVLSDARKQVHQGLNTWLAAQPRADRAISAVTLLVINRGILQIERRDQAAGAHLRRWLDTDVSSAFEGAILAIDGCVAYRAARLHVPDPMPGLDALIAATALVHDLTLVTRNTKYFQRVTIDVLNSWQL